MARLHPGRLAELREDANDLGYNPERGDLRDLLAEIDALQAALGEAADDFDDVARRTADRADAAAAARIRQALQGNL